MAIIEMKQIKVNNRTEKGFPIKEIIIYFAELFVIFIPIILLVLNDMLKGQNIDFIAYTEDGELIWVAVATLSLTIIRLFFKKKEKHTFTQSVLMMFTLLMLLIYVAIFSIIKISVLDSSNMGYQSVVISSTTIIFFIIAAILNIVRIIVFREEEGYEY